MTTNMTASTIDKQIEDQFAKLQELQEIELDDNKLKNFVQQYMVRTHHFGADVIKSFRKEIEIPQKLKKSKSIF